MIKRFTCWFLLLASLPAFTLEKGEVTIEQSTVTDSSQPADERAAQESLPMSKDNFWTILAKAKIKLDAATGIYTAQIPDDIKKISGTEVSVSGFMLPLESTETFRHFLLSKRTPTCPFCPPGLENEIIEVIVKQPVEWAEDIVTVKGKFVLTENREMGVFFKMTDAELK